MADLFTTLGIESVEEPKPEKKKSSKSTAKKTTMYKTPITVQSGIVSNFVLSADSFAGKNEVSETEVKIAIEKIVPYFNSMVTKLFKVDENTLTIAVEHSAAFALTKGNITITKETKVLYGNRNLNESGEFIGEHEVSKLQKTVILTGTGAELLKLVDGTILVLPGIKREWGDVNLPAAFRMPNGKTEFLLTADILSETGVSLSSGDDEEEEDNSTGVVNKVSADTICEWVTKKWPTQFGNMKPVLYTYTVEGAPAYTVRAGVKSTVKTAETKIELYKTNVPLWIYNQIYEIKPEYFGGKEEVTKEELLLFVRTKMVEYGLAQRNFSMFDEKSSSIKADSHGFTLINYTSSSKGATLVDVLAESEKKDFFA